ncbi:MATE family efflux transporter [bacterium]|nr:MATE family efflux transporter [bacterium]
MRQWTKERISPEVRKEYRTTLHLAWPVVVGQIGHVTVGVADSAMVGRIGAVPLAASAFANSLFVIPLVLGIGMAYGLTPLSANRSGSEGAESLADVLRNGLWLNMGFGLLLMGALFGIRPFLGVMGQDATVAALAVPYLGILSLSMLPLMLFLTVKQFIEGLGDTKTGMRISLWGNGVNIVLNAVMIYGWLGFPALGLLGAGIATLIARVLMALAIVLLTRKSTDYAPYWKPLASKPPERETLGDIARLGLPTSLQYLFEVSAFALSALMVGTLGAVPLAAHQIAISLASISYMGASGISAAATIRVGTELGLKKPGKARRAGLVGLTLGAGIMLLSGLVFLIGRTFLPSLYSPDAEVVAMASSLLIIAVFFQLSDGLQVVALGALRGMADVRYPTWITFLAYWIVALPMAWVVGIQWKGGTHAIWGALAFGLSVSAALLVWRFWSLSRKGLKAVGRAE